MAERDNTGFKYHKTIENGIIHIVEEIPGWESALDGIGRLNKRMKFIDEAGEYEITLLADGTEIKDTTRMLSDGRIIGRVEINGKTVHRIFPFKNLYKNFS